MLILCKKKALEKGKRKIRQLETGRKVVIEGEAEQQDKQDKKVELER